LRNRVFYLVGPEKVELRQEDPPEPGRGELRLRVEAAATCGTDVKVFRRGGHPRMLTAPSPFGHEVAGVVDAVGAGVQGYALCDRVVVLNSSPCGTCRFCAQSRENLCTDLHYLNGAFADYLLVPARFVERSTLRVDPTVAFAEAALTEPLACVLHGVEMCALPGAAEVAVIGAGPIGLLFAAVLSGAGHRVAAVDPHPARLEIARRMGAASTLEAGNLLTSAALRSVSSGGGGFDVVVEAAGSPAAWEHAVAALSPGGLALFFGGCSPGTSISLDTHRVHYRELAVRGAYHHRPVTARRALDLIARRAVDVRPLISAELPLERLEEGLRAMMQRSALKVVLRPGGG
jgi:L-iditol 2-dehydrogenase